MLFRSLQVIGLGYIFYGIGMTLMNAFNGAGDSKTPTKLNFFLYWLFQIPLAYVLSIYLNFKSLGVFLAILITEVLITLVSMYIFKKGKWKEVKV